MAIIWIGTGRFNAYIGPVQDYIDRVVAADVAAGNTLGLEVGVRDAYDVFIRDSINVGDLGTSGGVLSQANSIIKAAPIMAGARTRAGARTPLVGPTPTEHGTAGGWNYNRRTGLQGNGTNNYWNSGRAGNADPRDSQHAAVFGSSLTIGGAILSDRSVVDGVPQTTLSIDYGTSRTGSISRGAAVAAGKVIRNGFYGVSRSAASLWAERIAGISYTETTTSAGSSPNTFKVFVRGDVQFFNTSRLSFYSIGENLTLSTLDTRLTTLMAAIQAAIP